jgi:nitroimidazol reductase NimA-like FMN-containing flavoprotein (pyridoxamine 5'-phosphate oxidase superfamily)
MRRKDKEITDPELFEAIIAKADVCRIALFDGSTPYIIPLNFGYSGNCLYFHTARSGKKLDILRRNNRICFEIESGLEIVKAEKACDWTMKYYSIIGYGRAEIIEAAQSKVYGLNVIMQKYSGQSAWDYPAEMLERIVIIKLPIEEMTGKKSGY